MGEPKKPIKGHYNISAFFFFPLWAAHRKLYYVLGVLILCLLGIMVLEIYFNYDLSMGVPILSFAFWLGYQDLYFEHIIKHSRKLKSTHNHEEILAYFKRHGGTSMIEIYLCIPVCLIIIGTVQSVIFSFFPPPV